MRFCQKSIKITQWLFGTGDKSNSKIFLSKVAVMEIPSPETILRISARKSIITRAKVKSTQVEVKWEKCRVIGGRPDLRDARLYVCSAVGEGCFLKWCVIDDAKPENPCHTETQTKASTQSYGRCRHSPFCISIHSLCKERKRENHESNSFHFKVSNFINRSYCIVS